MTPNTLVEFNRPKDSEGPRGFQSQYPFSDGERFVYLGDIVQMPGHAILISMSNDKVYVGYHTDMFSVVPMEEA